MKRMERKQAAREDQEVLKGREWVSGPWGLPPRGESAFSGLLQGAEIEPVCRGQRQRFRSLT